MINQLNVTEHSTHYVPVIKATSIGYSAANIITREGIIGRVNAIFDRSISILTTQHKIITIAREDIGNSNYNIIVDIPSYILMSQFNVSPDSTVIGEGKYLLIDRNGIYINLNDVTLWQPISMAGKKTTPSTILQNCSTARKIGTQFSVSSGLVKLLYVMEALLGDISSHNIEILDYYAAKAFPYVKDLVSAIYSDNEKLLSICTSHLIGLGPGLTPACDDMLGGLMSSLIMSCKITGTDLNCIRKVNSIILSRAADNTTLFSYQLLAQSSIGEAAEFCHNLVIAILTGNKTQVIKATFDLIHVGHSSGVDTLVGILLGINIALKLTKNTSCTMEYICS